MEQLRQRRQHQVDPLLVHQPATSASSGTSARTGSPSRLLQGPLAGRLAGQPMRIVVAGRWRSLAGFHSPTSMPLRIPVSRPAAPEHAVEPLGPPSACDSRA